MVAIRLSGFARPDGLYARCGGTVRRLHVSREPIAAQDVCEVCGGMVCDCITPTAQAALLARIDADPHGYNDLSNLDLPY